MATIQLTEWTYYKNGKSGVSRVYGYEDDSRRVARCTFRSPSTGASGISLALHTGGVGAGDIIPIRYFIGTDPDSHANAGYDAEYTGTLTLSSDYVKFTASADLLLAPDQTYYLWVFPGEDKFGWFWATRLNYTHTLITSGAALSEISGANGVLGSEHTLKLKRYSSALTHTIKAACGKKIVTIATGLKADSVEWTPPIEWSAQNTTGTSVPVVITCTTYNGSTAIGSTSVSLTFAIPASVAPFVSFTAVDKLGYPDIYGKYIQGKSKLEVTVEGDGVYGSTITAYSVICSGQAKTGEVTVFDLPKAGTILITVKATDSRGRTTEESGTISVMAYTAPTATITSVYRCDAGGNEDPDGELARAVFSATVPALDGRNSASYVLKYRPRGTTAWTSVALEDLTGQYSITAGSRIVGVSLELAYEFSLQVTDNFGPAVESSYRTIQVAFAFIQMNRATKSLGVGVRATMANTAMFGLAAMLMKGLRLVPVTVESFEEIDTHLSAALANLDDNAMDFQCYRVDGLLWHCILFKKDSDYASAEFFSYNGRKRKALIGGIWGPVTAENEDKFQPMTQAAYDALVQSGNDDPTAFYMILEDPV